MYKYLLILMMLMGCSSDINYHPTQSRLWHSETVEVIICPDNPVKISKIEQAFEEVSAINPKYTFDCMYAEDCSGGEPSEGEIWITKFRSEDRGLFDLALTTSYGEPGGCSIDWAIIYLRKKNSIPVIKHEILHAFGWNHVPESGHLMSGNSGIVTTAPSEDGLDWENEKYLTNCL